MLEQEFTVANYQERSQNILPSKCVLIIPAGKHIALHVSGRVPVLHDDVIVDVPVNKTSVARGSLARDSKPEGIVRVGNMFLVRVATEFDSETHKYRNQL